MHWNSQSLSSSKIYFYGNFTFQCKIWSSRHLVGGIWFLRLSPICFWTYTSSFKFVLLCSKQYPANDYYVTMPKVIYQRVEVWTSTGKKGCPAGTEFRHIAKTVDFLTSVLGFLYIAVASLFILQPSLSSSNWMKHKMLTLKKRCKIFVEPTLV